MQIVENRLEAQYTGRLNVICVDIQSTAGEIIARENGLFLTPSFLFFNAQGQEAFRTVGRLDLYQIRVLLEDQK